MKNNKFNAEEKILRYVDKLDYFLNGHKTLIVTELDLTNKCNNACPACCGVNENGKELSKEQIDRIIASLVEIDCKGVILSGGGDPLLSPYFTYTVEQLKFNGFKIGLNSNGLALNDDNIGTILKYCEYFRVSLDAASPELYKKTHGVQEQLFKKVVDNCAYFAQQKKMNHAPISFGIGFLTREDTITELEDFVVLCKKTGVDFAQFRPYIGDFTDISDKYLDLKKRYETEDFSVLASLQKYREMDKNIRTYSKCHGMFFSTVITADMKVYSCLHHRQDPDYFLGDMNQHTLSEIFRSERMRAVYENIDFSKCPPFCRNDVFSRILHTLSTDITHKEFL